MSVIVTVIVLLWQRQPNLNTPVEQNSSKATITKQIETVTLEIIPSTGSILNEQLITFEGKSSANNYILLVSNNTLGISQADDNGDFDLEVELVTGLNLINIFSIRDDFSQDHEMSLTIYITEDSEDTTILAGPVKSIFDNIITISTNEGDHTIRQKTSTDIILPEDDDEEDEEIRVGDYLITLGEIENEKDFNATLIEIIREDKPHNIEKYVAGKGEYWVTV